jgi:hypothetical protein
MKDGAAGVRRWVADAIPAVCGLVGFLIGCYWLARADQAYFFNNPFFPAELIILKITFPAAYIPGLKALHIIGNGLLYWGAAELLVLIDSRIRRK